MLWGPIVILFVASARGPHVAVVVVHVHQSLTDCLVHHWPVDCADPHLMYSYVDSLVRRPSVTGEQERRLVSQMIKSQRL